MLHKFLESYILEQFRIQKLLSRGGIDLEVGNMASGATSSRRRASRQAGGESANSVA